MKTVFLFGNGFNYFVENYIKTYEIEAKVDIYRGLTSKWVKYNKEKCFHKCEHNKYCLENNIIASTIDTENTLQLKSELVRKILKEEVESQNSCIQNYDLIDSSYDKVVKILEIFQDFLKPIDLGADGYRGEELLTKLKDLGKELNLESSINELNKEIRESLKKVVIESFGGKDNNIKNVIRNIFYIAGEDFSSQLFKNNCSKIDVFTTNYDQIVEKCFEGYKEYKNLVECIALHGTLDDDDLVLGSYSDKKTLIKNEKLEKFKNAVSNSDYIIWK